MTPDALQLLPEPRIAAFILGNYEFDPEATIEHYDQVFDGRSAEEVIRFLNETSHHIFYDAVDEISFIVKEKVTLFDYSAIVILKFKDGVFAKSDVTAWGVK